MTMTRLFTFVVFFYFRMQTILNASSSRLCLSSPRPGRRCCLQASRSRNLCVRMAQHKGDVLSSSPAPRSVNLACFTAMLYVTYVHLARISCRLLLGQGRVKDCAGPRECPVDSRHELLVAEKEMTFNRWQL